jgi:V8-like Glu-specific endopeptidase
MPYARRIFTLALLAVTSACADNASVTAPDARVPDGPSLISAGRPTGSAFGGVGVLIIDEGANLTVDGFCSGSLISPTVFLTAGHCIVGPGTDYYISFAPDVIPLPPVSQLIKSSTAFRASNTDVGVVVLPAGSTTGIPVYDLPSLGYLETAKKGGQLARETATVVGYGIASLGRGPATSNFDGIRRVAETRVLSIQGPFLFIADSHGQSGQGGTCSGDSGGPVFLSEDPTLIVAITTSGFPEGCHAIGIYTRIDTEAALSFLSQFVTL